MLDVNTFTGAQILNKFYTQTMTYYKDSYLAKNSLAYELYQQWQKTKDAKDKKALDQHMKRLDQESFALLNKK